MRGLPVVAAIAALLVVAAPARAGEATLTFTQSGKFRVPAGVQSLDVRAIGGNGSAAPGGAPGGRGAIVRGTLAVSPGVALDVVVGAGGGTGAGNGGGRSGLEFPVTADAIMLAAGGGGGAGGGAGGDAGAPAGGANGGGAGTTSPGSGGLGAPAGAAGGPRVGGNGGAGTGSGGGGGAGLFGGGGGGAAAAGGGGGGGGGSNRSDTLTGASIALNVDNLPPSVRLVYTDNVAPTVTLDPVALNAKTITGTAGIDGGDGNVTLEFFEGDDTTGTPASAIVVGTDEAGHFSAALQVPEGRWTAHAVQGDAGNNRGVSAPRSFSIDTLGPHLAFTSPEAVTGLSLPTFVGDAGTADGDLPSVTVTITGAGAPITLTANVRGGSFSVTPDDPLPDGVYTATATQQDVYGHTGTATRTFLVDTVGPVVSLAAPEGDVTAAAMSGTAGEAPGDADEVVLEVRDGSVLVARQSAPVVNGAFAITLALADGLYTVTATQTDHGFNAGSARRTFRLDTHAPEIDTSAVRATYRLGEATASGFTCSDAGSGVAACDGPPAIDTGSVGEHSLTVTARDRAGNARAFTVRYSVVAPLVQAAPKPPTIRSASAKRKGKTVTLKLKGAAATATVTIAVGKTKKTVKVVKGAWSATLKLKTKSKSLKVRVGATTRTVKVR